MSPGLSLADLFLDRLEAVGPRCTRRDPGLSRALVLLVERAQRAWPDLGLTDEMIVGFLAECAAAQGDVGGWLQSVRVEDLCLARAVLAGNRRAQMLFNRRSQRETAHVLGQMGVAPSLWDDVRQEILTSLLVGSQAAGGKLATYGGRGDIWAWFRVVVARRALKILRRGHREVAWGHPLEDTLRPSDDPELLYMKAAYREAFRRAFALALQRLGPRDRNVLRYYVVAGLGIHEIAAVYRVHRSTVARWIARIRAKLLKETQRALMEELSIGEREFQSIVALVRSQLDLSLSRLLSDASRRQ